MGRRGKSNGDSNAYHGGAMPGVEEDAAARGLAGVGPGSSPSRDKSVGIS